MSTECYDLWKWYWSLLFWAGVRIGIGIEQRKQTINKNYYIKLLNI